MNMHDDEDDHPVDRVPGLERLTMEREPSRDLWAGIEARLDAREKGRAEPAPPQRPAFGTKTLRPRRRSWLPMAAAASFTAAIVSLMLVGKLPGSMADPDGASQPPVASAEPATTKFARSVAPSAAAFDGGAQAVPASWRSAPVELRKQNRGLIKANLKLVDNAEAQLRRAMAEDPQSAYLQRLLVTTQGQQQNLHHLLDKAQR
ncbi:MULTISPECIES: hypothetical protein [Hydrocarboniphaga]|uniref:Uncharacterized protein n=1 Tax=Hydrocarboniphaga effusa AP103 TaxID=1172194 RepID=I7ZD36_9GAMM|nr:MULTISPECIES: hypothetical protein [Hydrocarboniphaga]EIT69804.1 hypothetical protein WQQ_33860 [Hydrocarboniphaga effusa AP103]MDZ4078814.1 hypothetical protein [Hydrocarboniphaga sp.]